MKTLPSLFALVVLGLISAAHAQVFVTLSGTPPITFDSSPNLAAAEWASGSTNVLAGNADTYGNAAGIAAAVQAIKHDSVIGVLDRITGNSSFQAARHNTAGGYLITQPSEMGATVLKATLRNVSRQAFSHIRVSYSFGVVVTPGTEDVPGHQAFFSTNGQPNSWQPIPQFSGLTANTGVTATLFVGRWLPNTDIYLLWADDNAGGTDGGYTIDNFLTTNVVTTNASFPLSITLTAPANDTVVFPPVTLAANAAASPLPLGLEVFFYTNNVLAGSDSSHPYSLTLATLATGTYAVHALAINGSQMAASATNTVRVRPEFADYTGGIYTENFNSMGASGIETPLGWYAGITLPATTIDLTSGDGSDVASAAVIGWNYGTSGSGDRALGTAPTGADRNMVLRLRNNTATTILAFNLLYDGEVWRNYTNNTADASLTNYVSYDQGTNWIPTGFNFVQPPPRAQPQGAVDGNNPTNQMTNIGGTISPPTAIPPGGVVYFRWHDFNGSGTDGGLAVDNVRISATLRPTNDTCAGAIALTSGVPYSHDATLASDDGEQGLSGCAGRVNGVWFTITPSASGRLAVSTCDSDFRTEVVVYRGTCNSLVSYRCGFGGDFNCVNVARGNVEAPVAAGETYHILVGGVSSANPNSGNVSVLATLFPAPSNDQCSGAISLYDGFSHSVSTVDATTNGDPASVCSNPTDSGVWYVLTSGGGGRMTLDTDANFPVLIGVYGGSCALPVNNRCDFNSINSFSFNPGTYRFFVAGLYPNVGGINVSAIVCETPYAVSVSASGPTAVPDGIRMDYFANYSGTTATSFEWRFDNVLFTTTTSPNLSRIYGPFDRFPTNLTVTVINTCGSGNGTGGAAPACGAICLSVGIPQTRTGTNGSGVNSTLANPCSIPGTGSRWFQITTLTNASGVAMVSTEGSTYDTVLGVYRGSFSSPGNLFSVTCNDNMSPGNSNSLVRFETRPGSNYWLVVNPPPAGRQLQLTYGYEIKIASLSYNHTNRTIDLRSSPLASSPFQYRLLAASNLTASAANWSNLLTTNFAAINPASSNILRYLDTNPASSSRRFYRILRLP